MHWLPTVHCYLTDSVYVKELIGHVLLFLHLRVEEFAWVVRDVNWNLTFIQFWCCFYLFLGLFNHQFTLTLHESWGFPVLHDAGEVVHRFSAIFIIILRCYLQRQIEMMIGRYNSRRLLSALIMWYISWSLVAQAVLVLQHHSASIYLLHAWLLAQVQSLILVKVSSDLLCFRKELHLLSWLTLGLSLATKACDLTCQVQTL